LVRQNLPVPESKQWPAELRAIRATRPRRAARGKRAETFGAGLEQAEQLWEASMTVSATARPLLLFYGLCQAGRALCAAGVDHAGWQAPAMHGLQFECREPASGKLLDFSSATIKPQGGGLVQKVAEVMNSPVLTETVDMSRLTRSLGLPALTDASADPSMLAVSVNWLGSNALRPAKAQVTVWPIPNVWSTRTEPYESLGNTYSRVIPPSREELTAWLAPYPKLAEIARTAAIGHPEPLLDEDTRPEEPWKRWLVRVNTEEDMPHHEYFAWGRKLLDVDRTFVGAGPTGECIPLLGGNRAPQHPLIAWWLVLYGFSMLARYFPALWTVLLDADRSSAAVPIELTLEAAFVDVPRLLFEALRHI
jgi:hypothetical protein